MFHSTGPRRCYGAAHVLALALASTAVLAQTSASYRLDEHVLNSGGAPDGSTVASASYTLSLVAIGESVAGGSSPSSASYSVDGEFTSAYPAPGEVHALAFQDSTTLSWDVQRSAGTYNLYRDGLGALAGSGYGNCEQPDLTGTGATDTDTPAAGAGYFYLVTARNRLHEEGTKGSDSSDVERRGGVCP